MVPISLLDLAPITVGSDAGQALRNSLDLARHAERWGYRRFWLAEHHNMPGVASAATAVAIGFVAAGTSTIRVGAGGIMLPNHAPLVIAEQFGTLAALYPDRVDLGIGRAPGTDPATMRALRRQKTNADSFPENLAELMHYFEPAAPNQSIVAVPGSGERVPVWLLGSSLYSAELAASLGLPFAFASHFAPDLLLEALKIYRERFRPSPALSEPYSMACTHVYAADTDEEARRLFTSLERGFVALHSGRPGRLPPPVEPGEPAEFGEGVAEALAAFFRYSIIGSRETVRAGITRFLKLTGVNELMSTALIFDHTARLRSFELLAEVRAELDRV